MVKQKPASRKQKLNVESEEKIGKKVLIWQNWFWFNLRYIYKGSVIFLYVVFHNKFLRNQLWALKKKLWALK